MYMPSIFGESLFDDMFPFDDSFFTSKKNPLYGKNASRVMKTDIKENEGSYELDIDLPGFKKDEITAELKDGYLTVSAAKGLDKDEEDKKGHYIRQEQLFRSNGQNLLCWRRCKAGKISRLNLKMVS